MNKSALAILILPLSLFFLTLWTTKPVFSAAFFLTAEECVTGDPCLIEDPNTQCTPQPNSCDGPGENPTNPMFCKGTCEEGGNSCDAVAACGPLPDRPSCGNDPSFNNGVGQDIDNLCRDRGYTITPCNPDEFVYCSLNLGDGCYGCVYVPPPCTIDPVCDVSCNAPPAQCGTTSGFETQCHYTSRPDRKQCATAPAPDQSCSKFFDCPSGQVCNTSTNECFQCTDNSHCPSGQTCVNNACITSGCNNNGIRDNGETGIDCGGGGCPTCPSGGTGTCGDGIVQTPNSSGFNEQCDNGTTGNNKNGACPNSCSKTCTTNTCPATCTISESCNNETLTCNFANTYKVSGANQSSYQININFNDGESTNWQSAATVTHTYDAGGTYDVSMQARKNDGTSLANCSTGNFTLTAPENCRCGDFCGARCCDRDENSGCLLTIPAGSLCAEGLECSDPVNPSQGNCGGAICEGGGIPPGDGGIIPPTSGEAPDCGPTYVDGNGDFISPGRAAQLGDDATSCEVDIQICGEAITYTPLAQNPVSLDWSCGNTGTSCGGSDVNNYFVYVARDDGDKSHCIEPSWTPGGGSGNPIGGSCSKDDDCRPPPGDTRGYCCTNRDSCGEKYQKCTDSGGGIPAPPTPGPYCLVAEVRQTDGVCRDSNTKFDFTGIAGHTYYWTVVQTNNGWISPSPDVLGFTVVPAIAVPFAPPSLSLETLDPSLYPEPSSWEEDCSPVAPGAPELISPALRSKELDIKVGETRQINGKISDEEDYSCQRPGDINVIKRVDGKGRFEQMKYDSSDIKIITNPPDPDEGKLNSEVTGVGSGTALFTAYLRSTAGPDGKYCARCSLTVNVEEVGPWWQTEDSDVSALGSIKSDITQECVDSPQCSEQFSLPGDGEFPGVVAYGGTSATFGKGTTSKKGWLANSLFAGKRYDYAWFTNLAPPEVFTDPSSVITGETVNGGNLVSGYEKGGYIWRYRDGNLTVNGTANLSDRKVILIVNGDLRLNDRITLTKGQGFFMAIVKGGIDISGDVSHPNQPGLEGLFLADGSINTGTHAPTADDQLYVRGTLVSWSSINLQRDLGSSNGTKPAEFIEFAPDLIFTFPRDLARRGLLWREVAP